MSYSKPTIGVHKRGTVSFNGAAFSLLADTAQLSDKTDVYVQLLYDPERKIVGFKPVARESTHSYPLRKQRKAETYILTGGGFFHYYRIDVPIHRRFTARIYDDNIVGFSLLESDEPVPGESVKPQP